MPDALDFHPEKIPVAEFPFPPGSGVDGGMGAHSIVIDRNGLAFLACCAAHEQAGIASGYYPVRDKDRICGAYEALDGPPADCGRDDPRAEWQESEVGTVLGCGCEVGRHNFPCTYHGQRYGVARPDCGDCRFGVPSIWHKCGE